MEARPTSWKITPLQAPLRGEHTPHGDRPITNLALTLAALAVGATNLKNAVESPGTVATRRILALLGVSFTTTDDGWLVVSKPDQTLSAPQVELDCGGQVETFTLMLGLLVGQRFSSHLVADICLANIFDYVKGPLDKMGARITPSRTDGKLSLRIKGNPLYPAKLAFRPGAEPLKNTLLMAALFAVGESRFDDAVLSCDHLERIQKTMGVNLRRQGASILIEGGQRVYSRWLRIPRDISAAAPLITLAALYPGSEILFKETGINPGRSGFLKVLSRSGVGIERKKNWQYGSEPVADILVKATTGLQTINAAPNLAPSMARELALLALVATQANGSSSIKGLEVLDYGIGAKASLAAQILRSFGGDVEVGQDGLAIHGPTALSGTEVQCAGNRDLACMAAVTALLAKGKSTIHGTGYEAGELPNWMPEGCCKMVRG